MDTPICDFIRDYEKSGSVRLHMPGHKGLPFLGCEPWDITEIAGADDLYAPGGIIARSEENAASLFGAAHTFYSTEGSSQCIRAMLHLTVQNAAGGERPIILAARNVHQSFLYAAALLDFDVVWLWPEKRRTLCACPVSPARLAQTLDGLNAPPCAVYVTSPDYLGNQLDLGGLATVCRAHGIPFLVDNAHGAYLHFLPQPSHPLDLGAAACCDSAHKTLPVLTGGAYLQIAKDAPKRYGETARSALALFGSTSPSYLTLQSLDRANAYLADGYEEKLLRCVRQVEDLRMVLRERGWTVPKTEPLKLTLDATASGHAGHALAKILRNAGIECEYADLDFVVLMFTPENREPDFQRIAAALGQNDSPHVLLFPESDPPRPVSVMPIRRAILSPHESLPPQQALGRICGTPAVSCPPAVPIVSSGEVFGLDEIRLCEKYGIRTVDIVC